MKKPVIIFSGDIINVHKRILFIHTTIIREEYSCVRQTMEYHNIKQTRLIN